MNDEDISGLLIVFPKNSGAFSKRSYRIITQPGADGEDGIECEIEKSKLREILCHVPSLVKEDSERPEGRQWLRDNILPACEPFYDRALKLYEEDAATRKQNEPK